MWSDSLWGADFSITDTQEEAKKIIQKISKPKDVSRTVSNTINSKKTPIRDKIELIRKNVYRILGKFAENTQVIRDRETLHKYIDCAIENGDIAIDTETNNSLQPVNCKLMGGCIYTRGQKQAYIPINHINIDTNELLPNQLTEQDVAEEFNRLKDTKIIMHNANFDYRVIKCTTGISLKVYWDTQLGAFLLDENTSHKLKDLYISLIDSEVEKYNIESMFEKLPYDVFDPELFALYAATDAWMTYKLYEYQVEQFKLKDNKNLFNIFMNIEMPISTILAEMEITGLTVDTDYTERLSAKYNKLREDAYKEVQDELAKYNKQVADWRLTDEANRYVVGEDGKKKKSKNEQLKDPIEISSSTQLSILLYDILKIEPPNKEKPRAVGKDELKEIKLPLCEKILTWRGIEKLINTYIDAIPELVVPETGRIHTNFNQHVAKTGRLSSSDPNLQNIPAKNQEIRLMFKASDGKILVGSDYSQQEPRLLSWFAKDDKLIESYRKNLDLYATLGANVYHNDYWDNMEHHQDGSSNPEGKMRRKKMKSLQLGISYQEGNKSIAEALKISLEDAQGIIDNYYKSFPNIKTWIDDTKSFCHKYGYVEDLWGRRRRLPTISLPKYVVNDKSAPKTTFNPILGCNGKSINYKSKLAQELEDKLLACNNWKDARKIKDEIKKNNLILIENSGKIAEAERQSVNARIQSSAGELTKLAMIRIFYDKELNDLGFKLVLQIHDEVIGECPIENADACAQRLTYLMVQTAIDEGIGVPFKCDPTVEINWNEEGLASAIKGEYEDLVADYNKKGLDTFNIKNIIRKNHTELTDEQFEKFFVGA